MPPLPPAVRDARASSSRRSRELVHRRGNKMNGGYNTQSSMHMSSVASPSSTTEPISGHTQQHVYFPQSILEQHTPGDQRTLYANASNTKSPNPKSLYSKASKALTPESLKPKYPTRQLTLLPNPRKPQAGIPCIVTQNNLTLAASILHTVVSSFLPPPPIKE